MALGSAIHKRSSCAKNVVHILLVRDYSQTYPKWTIPTSHTSVVLQDVLFCNACILSYPMPLMSFNIAVSEINKDTRSLSVPWTQEGFCGPGISLTEDRLYLRYKA